MNSISPSVRYYSGEPIQAGDQVSLSGEPGKVLFVLGTNDSVAEFDGSLDWYVSEYGSGFMIDHAVYGLMFFQESSEDLELVSRTAAM